MINAAPVVDAQGLTRRFGAFTAVDHIDLTIVRGEIFGFLGPNGAGKSTTIRMLCGLLPPSEGSIQVLGVDVVREPERIKPLIGYMGQRSSLYGDLTVRELLNFYGRVYGLPDDVRRARVADWIRRAGLAGAEQQLVATLSGGWRQRLALGCAVLHEPHLLLLDEPTSGTDPMQRREFWDLIYRFADDGTTVLVTTHYLDEAEHCTVLAFIHSGRILAHGTPVEIKRDVMRGGIVEIAADPWPAALEALLQHPAVMDAALYGVAIHAVVGDPDREAPLLARFLQDRGVTVVRAEPKAPSLEDVFVSLEQAANHDSRFTSAAASPTGRGGHEHA